MDGVDTGPEWTSGVAERHAEYLERLYLREVVLPKIGIDVAHGGFHLATEPMHAESEVLDVTCDVREHRTDGLAGGTLEPLAVWRDADRELGEYACDLVDLRRQILGLALRPAVQLVQSGVVVADAVESAAGALATERGAVPVLNDLLRQRDRGDQPLATALTWLTSLAYS